MRRPLARGLSKPTLSKDAAISDADKEFSMRKNFSRRPGPASETVTPAAHGPLRSRRFAFRGLTARKAPREERKIVMAIGNAVQRGSFVYVYDEKGHQTATIAAGADPKDGLTGYTSSTVNVRRNAFIYTYDEKGRQIATTPAR
jgi:hypothetical protein